MVGGRALRCAVIGRRDDSSTRQNARLLNPGSVDACVYGDMEKSPLSDKAENICALERIRLRTLVP